MHKYQRCPDCQYRPFMCFFHSGLDFRIASHRLNLQSKDEYADEGFSGLCSFFGSLVSAPGIHLICLKLISFTVREWQP
jgi:hypothetical protein